jgi:transposase
MFPALPELKVFLAIEVTDMRKSINGLSIFVAEHLELDPFAGHLFAFCNRKRDIVKILYWDRNGFCLWQKRLEKDRFRWPESAAEVLSIGGRELSWLIEGLSLDQQCAHQRQSYTTVI